MRKQAPKPYHRFLVLADADPKVVEARIGEAMISDQTK